MAIEEKEMSLEEWLELVNNLPTRRNAPDSNELPILTEEEKSLLKDQLGPELVICAWKCSRHGHIGTYPMGVSKQRIQD
ncbi:hypothetical protein AB4332_03925 [Vibrio breoganii]